MRSVVRCLLVALWLVGCTPPAANDLGYTGGPGGLGGPEGGFDPLPFGGARPVKLFVPGSYQRGQAAPLVVLLHGYSADGKFEDEYLGFTEAANARGVLYAFPDGVIDAGGKRFWSATDACCNFDDQPVDDVAYLGGLVDEIAQSYDVDPRRVYFVGHSNGGFMSYRMACERADLVAAVVSLAGVLPSDLSRCQPSQPVSVMHVHGTLDETIRYEGGVFSGAPYPGAVTTVERWAQLNGCAPGGTTDAGDQDLDSSIPGGETSVERYQACQPGGAVELWTISGGSHLPGVRPALAQAALGFLLAHPKP